jgi:hypothetical protein
MITKSQRLGLVAAGLTFILGVSLLVSNPQPGNLHFSSLAFLFVGIALFTGTLTAWLNERYHRTSLLASGLVVAVLLFIIALVFALWSYNY